MIRSEMSKYVQDEQIRLALLELTEDHCDQALLILTKHLVKILRQKEG